MGYYAIRYNQHGEPYIVEKNFGYDPLDSDNRSHWTWHITPRGVKHLSRDHFGRPQKMSAFINSDQLADLKTYGMLRRSDGTLVGVNPIYPSEMPAKPPQQPIRPKQPAQPVPTRVSSVKTPGAQPVQPPAPARPAPTGQRQGFWAWLKSLFSGKGATHE